MKSLFKVLSITLFVAANANSTEPACNKKSIFEQTCLEKKGTIVPTHKVNLVSSRYYDFYGKTKKGRERACCHYGGKASNGMCNYLAGAYCKIDKGSYQMQSTGRGTEMVLMKYPASASVAELVNAIKRGLPKNHQGLIKLDSKDSTSSSVSVGYGTNNTNTQRYSLQYSRTSNYWVFNGAETDYINS